MSLQERRDFLNFDGAGAILGAGNSSLLKHWQKRFSIFFCDFWLKSTIFLWNSPIWAPHGRGDVGRWHKSSFFWRGEEVENERTGTENGLFLKNGNGNERTNRKFWRTRTLGTTRIRLLLEKNEWTGTGTKFHRSCNTGSADCRAKFFKNFKKLKNKSKNYRVVVTERITEITEKIPLQITERKRKRNFLIPFHVTI